MNKFGDVLTGKRQSKGLSLKKISNKLLIKEEHLLALEKENWSKLPETTFVKGYIKTYSEYLGLDPNKMLALYRREFDEKLNSTIIDSKQFKKTNFITPTKLKISIFTLAIMSFVSYIAFQYSSILSAPSLEIYQPPDDISVSIPIIEISGKAESESQVAIDGEFVPIDFEGNFSYFINLDEGENNIEIIASKRLSPKSKITKIIRLHQ